MLVSDILEQIRSYFQRIPGDRPKLLVGRKLNAKVLGTGNRTEYVQGYAAKWGTPMAFDFGVLDELYKADVYRIAEVLQVPGKIVEQEPSTGYFPGQTHERELGATLKEQDAGAYLLFEKRMTPGEIEFATRRGIKVLCLYREDRKFFASPMVRGMTPDRYPHVSIQVYRDAEEAKRAVGGFLNARTAAAVSPP